MLRTHMDGFLKEDLEASGVVVGVTSMVVLLTLVAVSAGKEEVELVAVTPTVVVVVGCFIIFSK